VASLSQGRTAAAQCGLFTYKSVPVIFEPPCIMSVFLYSCLRYPAFKSHLFRAVLCCQLWPLWLYHIFPHYHINGSILGGSYWAQNVYF